MSVEDKKPELKRCESCKGKKEVMGLGMIMKKCPDCLGVGWVEKKEEKPIEIKKKRKKYVKVEEPKL